MPEPPEALPALYEAGFDAQVRRLGRMMLSKDDALDAAQEAYLGCWKHRSNIRNMSACIAVSARNRANTIWRRSQREVAMPVGREFPVPSGIRASDLDIKRAVDSLSPRQKLCVELKYWGGYDALEIVEKLRDEGVQTTVGAVHSVLSHARQRLASQLAEYRQMR